ncbi:MAG: YgfZ/GcvT domain-containing protein [Myxococcota bacterium]
MPTLLDAQRTSLIVSEVPARRTLRVRGKDAVSWLNGLVTCDVAAVDARRGAYGLLLTKQGKIVTDLDIVKSEGGLLLGMGDAVFDAVCQLLDRYLVMEDVELEPAPELSWLRLTGRGAEDVQVEGVVARGSIDWLRIGGEALVTSSAQREACLQALKSVSLHASAADWELLRLAHGFPKFGVDFGPDDNPHEASLERRAVSWSKGCYLGQEVVCMQDMRGRVKRRLTPLEIAADAAAVDAEVRAEGEAESVGRLTSVASAEGRAFCMARLRAPFFEGLRALEVAGRPARILTPPSAG